MAVEVNNTATQANADKRTYSVQEIADILQISPVWPMFFAENLCSRPFVSASMFAFPNLLLMLGLIA